MTIIRCKICHIVVLDSTEDIDSEVYCPECRTRYLIKLTEGEVVRFEKSGNHAAGRKEG